jgi:hypothetical protein
MHSRIELLLEMIGESRFDAFLAQLTLSPEVAEALCQGLCEGASPEAAQTAATTLAEQVWAFLDDDPPNALAISPE